MTRKEVKISSVWHLNAKTFQEPLNELANTIAYKVQREGHALLPTPSFVIADIYYLLRQAHQTYNLFRFMNADERRQKDVDYRIAYSALILPLVRTMIDCLYNITSILENPDLKGHQFRESGLKQIWRHSMPTSKDTVAIRSGMPGSRDAERISTSTCDSTA